jgi:urease beta subunit
MTIGPARSLGEGGLIGGVRHPPGRIRLAEGRRRIRLTVANTSMRPVRVSSHYPFWRANARLLFDREGTRGFRLDIPAGSSVRWAPGETLEVGLVAYGGSTGPREP